jgi:hypothetical protein
MVVETFLGQCLQRKHPQLRAERSPTHSARALALHRECMQFLPLHFAFGKSMLDCLAFSIAGRE